MHGARGALFPDGRQPRCERRQPLLGLRPGPQHRGQGVHDLVELRRVPARRAVDTLGRDVMKRQRGVTLTGFIAWAAVAMVVVVVGTKMLPSYIEYWRV